MTVDLELAERFVKLLQAHARGEAKAMTANTILAALDLKATDNNRREIRACAQHAVQQMGHLICSGSAGYFTPATPEEVATACGRLRSEAYELIRRAKRAEELAAEHFDLAEAPELDDERPSLLALMEA